MSKIFSLSSAMLFIAFTIFSYGAFANHGSGKHLDGVTVVPGPRHLKFDYQEEKPEIDERYLPYKLLKPVLEKIGLPFAVVRAEIGEKQLDDSYLYEEGRLARLAALQSTSVEKVRAKITARKPKMPTSETAILCDIYTIGAQKYDGSVTTFSSVESDFEESLKKYLFETRWIPTAYTFYQKVPGQDTKLPFQTLFNPAELLVICTEDSTIYVLEAGIGPSIVNSRLKTKPEDIRFAVYQFKIKEAGEAQKSDDETPVGQFKQVDSWTLDSLDAVEAFLKGMRVSREVQAQ